MKQIFFFLCLVVFALSVCKAQPVKDEKSPIVKFLYKRGYRFPDETYKRKIPDSLRQWPDTLYYNTVYRAKLLGSPTIPISFSQIEYIDKAFVVSPTISLGYGYTWFFGDFIFNENDKIEVDPTFFFGLIGDISLLENLNLNKLAGFFTGGFIGFKAYSLFLGYDFILKSPNISLGGRIDLYTIRQLSLKPFGKVRELRKHKSVANIISDE
jgi:hypothetical protein